MTTAPYSLGDVVHSKAVDEREAFDGQVVQVVRLCGGRGYAYIVRDAYGDDWHRNESELTA